MKTTRLLRLALTLALALTALSGAVAGDYLIAPGDSQLVVSGLAFGVDTVDSYKIDGSDTTRSATIITRIAPVQDIPRGVVGPRPNRIHIAVNNESASGKVSESVTEVYDTRMGSSLGLYSQEVRAKADSGYVEVRPMHAPTAIKGWVVPVTTLCAKSTFRSRPSHSPMMAPHHGLFAVFPLKRVRPFV